MSINFKINDSGSGNHHVNDTGAHQQSESELRENVAKLVEEYKRNHPVMPNNRVMKKVRDRQAEEWARKEEPKRDLPYLFESIDGVPADTKPRTVKGYRQQSTSSWVDRVERDSPYTVDIYTKDGNGPYTFKGTASQVEDFLTSGSLGVELNNAMHDGLTVSKGKNKGRTYSATTLQSTRPKAVK